MDMHAIVWAAYNLKASEDVYLDIHFMDAADFAFPQCP